MGSVDWQDPSRRLAGVDQALAGGGPRPPGELLGQLRERLGRLEPNHPSAYQAPDSGGAEPDSGADATDEDELPELAEEDQDEPGPEMGRPDTLSVPGGSPADLGLGPPLPDFGRPGRGDPYRPWFMDGEPGTPWFAE